MKAASLEDLQALPWLPDAVARAVHDQIHGSRRADQVTEAGQLAREADDQPRHQQALGRGRSLIQWSYPMAQGGGGGRQRARAGSR